MNQTPQLNQQQPLYLNFADLDDYLNHLKNLGIDQTHNQIEIKSGTADSKGLFSIRKVCRFLTVDCTARQTALHSHLLNIVWQNLKCHVQH